MTYIPPKALATKFTCPHCGAIVKQSWQVRMQSLQQHPDNARNPIRIGTCDHCGNSSLWHFDQMVFPDRSGAPPPNPDMPASVKNHYEEADIGSLVKKGLPATVQQSLDVVRLTGNNAVHPGQIDADDQEIVGALFTLVNVIVEYMFALPKRVGALYGAIPQGALDQIAKRDSPKT